MEGNNGIISFGNSSTNVIISTKSQQLKTNSRIDGVPRNMPPKDKKLSIKEQLQQAKKEQGEQSETPNRPDIRRRSCDDTTDAKAKQTDKRSYPP